MRSLEKGTIFAKNLFTKMLFLILFEIVVVDIHKSQQEHGPLGCTIKRKKAVPIDLSLKECRHCCSMGGGGGVSENKRFAKTLLQTIVNRTNWL